MCLSSCEVPCSYGYMREDSVFTFNILGDIFREAAAGKDKGSAEIENQPTSALPDENE
jgi:hypothetical protein